MRRPRRVAGEAVIFQLEENNHSAALMEMPHGTMLCLWNHAPENKLGHPEIVVSRLPLGSQCSPWKRVLAYDGRA